MRVILVACGAAKLARAAPARELYTGSLTRAAIRHAEGSGCPWYILSAMHHLVAPATILDPYEMTISQHRDERQRWARQVVGRLLDLHPGAVIELHAGTAYAAPIVREVGDRAKVERPLDGLTVGLRLAWYSLRRLA